jgi:AraC-like DNA-binding protein
MPDRALARAHQTVVNYQLQDPDGLAALISRRFSPVAIEPAGPPHALSVTGTYGTVAGIDFSRSHVVGAFRLTPQRHYDGVFFFFPTAGRLVFHQNRETMASTSEIAVAAEGTECRSMEFLTDHEYCGVVIDRTVLSRRLAVLLGEPIVERPTFQTAINIGSGGATALRSLVMCITSPEFTPQLNRAHLTANRIHEALVDLVLEAWPNTYSDMLRRPPPMIAPRHVKFAIDFIHEHARLLPSGTELAALSNVSLRALQAGFRRFLGTSITAYQRKIRLERARADLLQNPSASIEKIALSWGFTNASRFSRYFRAAYGHSPTELTRGGNASPSE